MIQKGIIESILSSYEYKVRIPRYDKLVTTPGGVPTENLSSAIVCAVPGTKVAFMENDIVLVGFENNELTKPVILGLLYRENSSQADQFNSIAAQTLLSSLEKTLNEIQANHWYTHIKYSNDNGLTFTSLYEYSDIETYITGTGIYKGIDNIEIDPNSSVIYWSAIDSNNVDITSQLYIITTLSTDDNTSTESFTGALIDIPMKFRGLHNLKLSFQILQTEKFDDYHIVLTTDKNTLGSVYGDYIGISVTTNPIPSLNPSDYSWSSFYAIYKMIDKLEASLLDRIERNEKTLYGYTYSTNVQETDNTGLVDGIRVEKDSIHIHGNDNKDIVFNSAGTIFIDNNYDNITTVTLEHTNVNSSNVFSDSYTDNGHLQLLVRKNMN